uniref:T9SS type A sorting domain-containing protein n=1 Tax=Flavobacterium sp. TaxID=239 RepID=UPI0040494541
MKKTVQKISILCFLALFSTKTINAQNDIAFSANGTWLAYLTCLYAGDDVTTPAVETSGQFFFADNWGIQDVKTVVSTANNTITLYPNYNLFATGEAVFVQNGVGTKIAEGNSFKEFVSTVEEPLTFSGYVQSNTLAPGYTVKAFVKGLSNDGNFFLIVEESVELVEGQNFTVTVPVMGADLIVQTGFVVTGLIGNPAQEAANGNMVVTAPNLSNQNFETAGIKMYPNPTTNQVNFDAPSLIENIALYNTVGQKVMEVTPQNGFYAMNTSNFEAGLYIVNVQINGVTSTSRLIKK